MGKKLKVEYRKSKVETDRKPKTEDLEAGVAEGFREANDKSRELLRLRHNSYCRETSHLDWHRRHAAYAADHQLDWRQESTLRTFLSFLATVRNVAFSTQNQAFCAVLFMFREVLKVEIKAEQAVRAKRGPKLPVVPSVEETKQILDTLTGTKRLLLAVTYGSGLRVSETVRLCVKDLDFDNLLMFVRDGKGNKKRSTLLSAKIEAPMVLWFLQGRRVRRLVDGNPNPYSLFTIDVAVTDQAEKKKLKTKWCGSMPRTCAGKRRPAHNEVGPSHGRLHAAHGPD